MHFWRRFEEYDRLPKRRSWEAVKYLKGERIFDCQLSALRFIHYPFHHRIRPDFGSLFRVSRISGQRLSKGLEKSTYRGSQKGIINSKPTPGYAASRGFDVHDVSTKDTRLDKRLQDRNLKLIMYSPTGGLNWFVSRPSQLLMN